MNRIDLNIVFKSVLNMHISRMAKVAIIILDKRHDKRDKARDRHMTRERCKCCQKDQD